MDASIYIDNGTLIIDFVKSNTTSLHRNVIIESGVGDKIKVFGDKPKRDVFFDMWGHKDAVNVNDPKNFPLFVDGSVEEYDTPALDFWQRPVSSTWNKEERNKWKFSRREKRIKIGVFVEYKKGTASKIYETTKYLIIRNGK